MEEKYIKANENAIGIKELRALHELSLINKMLIEEEYSKIVMIYNQALSRIEQEAKEQGIDI
ncbi:MAG: hypothetical protein ACRCX8_19400 [Sarcina sp.]